MASGTAWRIDRPSRRDLILGGMLFTATAVAAARTPRNRIASIGPDQLETLVPQRIGDWQYEGASGIVLPPPDELARLLYDQQLARLYVARAETPVMLAMAYGSSQGGMLQVHRPEICYPASGFTLSRTQIVDIPIGGGVRLPARFFTATSDTRTEQVLYWTRVGNALPTGWTAQRLAIMENNLSGDIPDGLLVRFSASMDDPQEALAMLGRFARTLLGQVGAEGRRKLIGATYARS